MWFIDWNRKLTQSRVRYGEERDLLESIIIFSAEPAGFKMAELWE